MRSLVLLITAVALLGGCRSSSEPEELRPFPIQMRSSVPADSVTVDGSSLIFSAKFNQQVSTEDVRLTVIPTPLSMGEPVAHARTFDQIGLEPWPFSLSHQILMDGPRFLRPYLVRVFTGDAGGDFWFPDERNPCLIEGDLGQVGELYGKILSPPGGPHPGNSVVFAYRRDGLGEYPDPELIFEIASPVAMVMPWAETATSDEAEFLMNHLIIYESYTVIVVLDTSGNGFYDPKEDWWGYPRDPVNYRLTAADAHLAMCAGVLDPVRLRRPIGSNPAP